MLCIRVDVTYLLGIELARGGFDLGMAKRSTGCRLSLFITYKSFVASFGEQEEAEINQ